MKVPTLALPDLEPVDRALQEAEAAGREEDFGRAVDLAAEAVKAQPLHTGALLKLAAAIQLADDARGFELDDCRQLLRYAVQIAPSQGVEHELANFVFAVDGNTPAALQIAEVGIRRVEEQLIELLAFEVEALRDAGKDLEAERKRQQAQRLFPGAAQFASAATQSTDSE